jgi:hypothetical protein
MAFVALDVQKLVVAPAVIIAALAFGAAAAQAASWGFDADGDGYNEGTAWDSWGDGPRRALRALQNA